MAIQKITNALLYGLSSDTKPTTYANNTLFIETDTGNIYQSQSAAWSLFIGASTFNSVSKTSAYTLTALDTRIRADATSAAFTLTLPTAVDITGKTYGFKKVDVSTNIVTIDPNSTQTVEGLDNWKLRYPNDYVEIVSDGANWRVIGQSEYTQESFFRKGS